MDVYHKVLAKLFEATGGRESEAVDLKELVKKEGFLPSYPDIFQHLSRQSWIAETPRPDVVKITHWGATEAKKSSSSVADNGQAIKRETTRVISEARELISILEEFSNDASRELLAKAERSADSIGAGVRKLKESI
jgi:hypothetical protein